ncbi:hypothetical protein [Luteibacter yeojuensis]|uniref:Uncharacterized protein n=1 Tax=Luteibacter yeojuensis TaxID=345309 RepID=A0A0F3KXA9_9GAMM|nr:hypothetical protein [Luteibacter yeojuensis]KJV34744.1 hypothetical protein VI08_09100 [Luteibacter yeojuensis]
MTALSQNSAIQRLVEQTIGLAQAMRLADHGRAVELASDMRDGAWAAGLSALGATAGALVGHLTDGRSSMAVCEVALDAFFTELQLVSAAHRSDASRAAFLLP